MSLRTTLNFLLYEWLDVNQLQQRTRFADHSQETFDAVLDNNGTLDDLYQQVKALATSPAQDLPDAR